MKRKVFIHTIHNRNEVCFKQINVLLLDPGNPFNQMERTAIEKQVPEIVFKFIFFFVFNEKSTF